MIVDPDFLDHWRTRMVADALADELAPIYIMRLWAHCQARKSDCHQMPPAGLKAQCRAPQDAQAFEQALTEAGFVKRDGDTIEVLGWAEQNASLIAAWENGGKGGRPKKEPKQNPSVNQDETHGKPIGNPSLTQAKPIREEKSREDKKGEIAPDGAGAEAPPSKSKVKTPPKPDDVGQQVWDDWLALRRGKRAAVTQTTLDEARREAAKVPMPLEAFLAVWCARGSQGLQADWVKPSERGSHAPVQHPTRHYDDAEATRQMLAARDANRAPPPPEIRAKLAEALRGKVLQ